MEFPNFFELVSLGAEASELDVLERLSSSACMSEGMLGEWLKFFILEWRESSSFDAAPFESEIRERFGSVKSFLAKSNDVNQFVSKIRQIDGTLIQQQ